jgi:hypothetical protein
MRFIFLGLICFLTALFVNAQEPLRDPLLAQKAIFDVENPRFVWAVQQSPDRLQMGLNEEEYCQLKAGDIISIVLPNEDAKEIRITAVEGEEILSFEYGFGFPGDMPAIGSFNIRTGVISDNEGEELYTCEQEGTVFDKNGKEVLAVGKEVDRKLGAFYILYFYTQQAKALQLFK